MPVETRDLERILNRIHQWTQNADVKTDILTATEAAAFGFLVSGVNGIMAEPATSFWFEAAFVLGIACLIAALTRSVLALFPRMHGSTVASVTFFGHIADRSLAEYRARLNTISDDELREDYVTQIHVSAVIAARKHRHIKRAVQLFCTGLLIISVTYLRLRGWF